jgi:hypothetical protein
VNRGKFSVKYKNRELNALRLVLRCVIFNITAHKFWRTAEMTHFLSLLSLTWFNCAKSFCNEPGILRHKFRLNTTYKIIFQSEEKSAPTWFEFFLVRTMWMERNLPLNLNVSLLRLDHVQPSKWKVFVCLLEIQLIKTRSVRFLGHNQLEPGIFLSTSMLP